MSQRCDNSAAVTPMLDPAHIAHLVRDLTPFVTEALWLDIMPQAGAIENWSGARDFEEQVAMIRHWQTPASIAALHAEFRAHPLVRWGPAAQALIAGRSDPIETAPPER